MHNSDNVSCNHRAAVPEQINTAYGCKRKDSAYDRSKVMTVQPMDPGRSHQILSQPVAKINLT